MRREDQRLRDILDAIAAIDRLQMSVTRSF